jgi:hypothetical protein
MRPPAYTCVPCLPTAGQSDHPLHGNLPDGSGPRLARGAALAAGRHQLACQEAVGCVGGGVLACCTLCTDCLHPPVPPHHTPPQPPRPRAGFLRRLLGQRMLVSCEVAVEYYLSMIHSPQVGGAVLLVLLQICSASC